jgi:beta-lactamase class A
MKGSRVLGFYVLGCHVLGFSVLSAEFSPARAQTTVADLKAKFEKRVQDIAARVDGVVGYSIVDLTSGERVGRLENATFPTASAIKLAIVYELFKQAEERKIRLTDMVTLQRAQAVGGTGVLVEMGTPTLSVRDYAVLMVTLSDNTATNILIDRVGMDRVNATTRALGVPEVKLQRKMIRPRDSAAGNENIATPTAAATIMARIATCELPMSKERCGELRRLLEIPKGGPIEASVPEGVRVAWKPGDFEGVNSAWGLVDLPGRPYVVVGMVNYSDAEEGMRALRRIADAAYGYFHVLARSTPYGARVPLDVIPK